MQQDARGGEQMEAMEFYESMSQAIKARDHARNMVTRWRAKELDADLAIEALVKEQEQPQTVVNQEA